MKTKNFNQSPLPFQGQKRRFQNDFKTALNQFSDSPLFVDLFGGSGLLSHWAKQQFPNAKVVYNDFDDYHLRIANIERTNTLLAKFRIILQNEPVQGNKQRSERTGADCNKTRRKSYWLC